MTSGTKSSVRGLLSRFNQVSKHSYCSNAAPLAPAFADGRVKSYDEMPTRRFRFGDLGAIFHYWVRHRNHFDEAFKKDALVYGPVYKEVTSKVTQVHVCGAAAMEDVFRQLDKYPRKPDMTVAAWVKAREQTGVNHGLLTSEQGEWHKYRHALSDKMLSRDVLETFDTEVNEIVSDFLERIVDLREADLTVPKLTNEFYRWAMETVGSFLFDKRLGILKDPSPPRTQEFIDAIADILHGTMYLNLTVDFHAKWKTKQWQQHKKAWSTVFDVSRYYFDEKLAEIEEARKSGSGEDGPTLGAFLSRVIASGQLTSEEISGNVIDIMLAGVDTTSNTMCFTLYYLAQYPDVQKKLQKEVDTVLAGRMPTGKDLSKMPYLKMVIKESMRLKPVVPVHVRCISKDAVIGGYHVPAMMPLILQTACASNDSTTVEDPDVFRPERWDRSNPAGLPRPYTQVPFSHGTRGCIGRRLAELELHTLLARIVQRFDVLPSDRYKLKPVYRSILTPGDNLPIQFVDRKLSV